MYRIAARRPRPSARYRRALRPLVEAALAKDPRPGPTSPQLLAELTNTQLTGVGAGLGNRPDRAAQTWHAPSDRSRRAAARPHRPPPGPPVPPAAAPP